MPKLNYFVTKTKKKTTKNAI